MKHSWMLSPGSRMQSRRQSETLSRSVATNWLKSGRPDSNEPAGLQSSFSSEPILHRARRNSGAAMDGVSERREGPNTQRTGRHRQDTDGAGVRLPASRGLQGSFMG